MSVEGFKDADKVDQLHWRRVIVQGKGAYYGSAGKGRPVVLLHGWALGGRSYKGILRRLVAQNWRVYAPGFPGFGGTSSLDSSAISLSGYASWLADFLDEVHPDEKVAVVGHSFGGGVGIQFAHDFPEKVRSLVLVNSVGTPTKHLKGKSLAEKSLLELALRFPMDLLPKISQVVPLVITDALPNLLFNPKALWKVANMAHKVELYKELDELKRRRLPVVVLWGDRDKIVPKVDSEALCKALGANGEVLPGGHSWLISEPEAFTEILTNILEVAEKNDINPDSSSK